MQDMQKKVMLAMCGIAGKMAINRNRINIKKNKHGKNQQKTESEKFDHDMQIFEYPGTLQ